MNNLLSYFGLTDARMRASEKDLPVPWHSWTARGLAWLGLPKNLDF